MAITASQVKELRASTGVGMLACKKALEESNGDVDKAVDILRKKGEARAASKSERQTAEGRIAIDGRAIIKLLCETDFVAKNEQFEEFANKLAVEANNGGEAKSREIFEQEKTDKIQAIGENLVLDVVEVVAEGETVGSYVHSNGKLGAIVTLSGGTEEMARDVAMHVVAMDPEVANPEDVSSEEIEKEKEIAREQLLGEGKPEQIIDKILVGKIAKFCAEKALTSQPFVKDGEKTVGQFLGDATVVKFIRLAV